MYIALITSLKNYSIILLVIFHPYLTKSSLSGCYFPNISHTRPHRRNFSHQE